MVEIAPKTIVWDLDGTLLDSFSTYRGTVSDIAHEWGIQVPSEQTFLEHHHGLLLDSIRDVLGIDEEAAQKVTTEFLERVEKNHHANSELYFDDAVELAKRAYDAKIPQVLVTNRTHKDTGPASPKLLIANSDLRHIFGHIVAGDDHTFRKPDKRVLDVIEGHNFIEDVVVIGDQYVDAEFARNIGAYAILVRRHGEVKHLERLGAGWQDHVTIVDSLDEVTIAA